MSRKKFDKLCQRCGKLMIGVDYRRQYCHECKIALRRQTDRESKRRQAANRKEISASEAARPQKIPPKPAIKSIEQVVREANAAKMSYGQYVAKMRR